MIFILRVIHDFWLNYKKMCLKIYELDPEKFLSALGFAQQAALKKTEMKLELLSGIDILLIVEKEIKVGVCHVIHQCAKANNKHMNDYDKSKESPYLKYWDVNNLYRQTMSRKRPVNQLKWTEDTSLFNKDSIKKLK